MKPPQHLQPAYNEEQLDARIAEMGVQIGIWAERVLNDAGVQPLAVCVLRGAVFFFADLLRAIPVSIEPAFCRASSYRTDLNAQGNQGVKVAVDNLDAAGRAVLLVDDICDTGSTLFTLEKVFRELGAHQVRSAVLIKRETPGSRFEPTWSAFAYHGEEWFVGYGLDDKGWYRNLHGVYTVPKDC